MHPMRALHTAKQTGFMFLSEDFETNNLLAKGWSFLSGIEAPPRVPIEGTKNDGILTWAPPTTQVLLGAPQCVR